MFEAMERGELRTLYVVGENPAQSEADAKHTTKLLEGLDHLVVQDIFLTRTAELADVVLPASASWCEAEGTVTNSERRVQRVRKALDPPGPGPRRHRDRRARSPPAWATTWRARRRVGLERAALALADARRHDLSAARGARRDPVAVLRRGAPRRALPPRPAVGEPGHGAAGAVQRRRACAARRQALGRVPIRLTTGRRLDSYNTGVQSGGYRSPLRRGESLDLSPEDCERLGRRRRRAGQGDLPAGVGLRAGAGRPTLRPAWRS